MRARRRIWPGSPPRMRGRPGRWQHKILRVWLTPANAGTTLRPASASGERQAHPRECGDDRYGYSARRYVKGSPPRMRGRPVCLPAAVSPVRLTPANAGTTCVTRCGSPSTGAHPRECGDDGRPCPWSSALGGSPPRMRGRRAMVWAQNCRARLTPANAGTTYLAPTAARDAKAHPRECGDDHTCRPSNSSMIGSPPRMRGRPFLCRL